MSVSSHVCMYAPIIKPPHEVWITIIICSMHMYVLLHHVYVVCHFPRISMMLGMLHWYSFYSYSRMLIQYNHALSHAVWICYYFRFSFMSNKHVILVLLNTYQPSCLTRSSWWGKYCPKSLWRHSHKRQLMSRRTWMSSPLVMSYNVKRVREWQNILGVSFPFWDFVITTNVGFIYGI